METVVIIFTIASAWIAVLVHKGNKVVQRQEKLLKEIGAGDDKVIEPLSIVSYHGGFSELPIPQKLNIAVSDEYLLLSTNRGEYGKLPFRSWKKIEKFTTLRKHDPKDRSMVLFGPFNNLLFKDSNRHFIAINHEDSAGQDSNLLIEHGSVDRLDEIFEKLGSSYRKYRLKGTS
jgi:hypothetical protein